MDQHVVLIVENDTAAAVRLETMIEQLGYRVSGVVTTGQAALQSLRADRSDVALLDLYLPGSPSGIDAGKAIRQEAECPAVF